MCGETGGNGEEGEEEEVVVGPMVGGKEGAKTISGHDDVILQTGDEGATRRGATTDMLVTNVASETVSSGGHGLCSLCLLYTSPSPRDQRGSRMPSSA